MKSNQKILILGGARSGKSTFAEQLAKVSKQDVVYIATAKVLDKEIAERVKHHQNDRPSHWTTIEEPIELSNCLLQHSAPDRTILVDCLTMWITNLLSEDDEKMRKELDNLINQLANFAGTIIFVSNEVGMGIIPMGELTRKYVDEAGRLHQQLAQKVEQVVLMVAGIPNTIKPSNYPNET